MRTGRFILILIILLISACSLFFIFSSPVLKLLASGLVVNQPIIKSDAVIVLGGSSPSRILEAIDILNAGLAINIIITRGAKPEGSEYLSSRNISYPEEADRNILVAEKLGIIEKDIILLPGRVYSTKEEAEAIKDFALKNGYDSLIIATSKSHSRRAELIFKKIFKYSGINVLIKPSKYGSFNPNNLDINKNHWKEVVLEYQKIFYFIQVKFSRLYCLRPWCRIGILQPKH